MIRPEVIKLEFILKFKIKRNDWPITALYFEFETVLKFCNLGVWDGKYQKAENSIL